MRRSIAIVVLAVVGAACGQSGSAPVATTTPTTTAVAPPSSTTTAAPAVDLQALVDDFAARFGDDLSSGGVVVAIAAGDELFVAAAGAQPDGTPLPADGAWRIGSVTKPFLATLVLQLVDERLVDLDAPVSAYVTGVQVPESVTVRDILGHRSGIFNITEDVGFLPESFADLEHRWDPTELVERALALREVPAEPLWAYSNTNYLLAGLLVEAVTGEPVHDALRSRIVEPLGLTATYLAGAETGPAPIDSFFSWAGNQLAIDPSFPYTSLATGAWTAGALVSNASDLAHFLRAVLGGDLISGSSLEAMTSFGVENYGLGILRFAGLPSDVWGHNGLIPGYFTNAAYSPDHDVAVILGVMTDDLPQTLERTFYEFLLAALAD